MKNYVTHTDFRTRGFTLVELIFYMAIMVLLLSLIVNTMLVIADSQVYVSKARAVEHAASLSMDRVIRETQGGLGVDTSSSILSATSSVLVIDKADGTEVSFSILDETLMIDTGTEKRPLTGSEVSVSEFRVDHIETGRSEAVKVVLVFRYSIEEKVFEEHFYSTVILRGSYGVQ